MDTDPAMLALLEQLTQPAFLVKEQELLACNEAGQSVSAAFRRLLDSGALGTPEGNCLGDLSLSMHPFGGCILVLGTPLASASDALTAAGRAIRRPVGAIAAAASALAGALEAEENPARQRQTAELRHNLYRLLRLSDNMEVVGAASIPLFLRRSDFCSMLREQLPELEDCCRTAGFFLDAELPARPLFLNADEDLLGQTVFNLLSNAMLFSVPGSRLGLSLCENDGRILLRIRSVPEGNPDAETFRMRPDSFDPRRGAGLGLIAARRVALLHGGTLVLQTDADSVTAILSLPKATGTVFASPRIAYRRDTGFDPILIGLSDVLPTSAFDSRCLP